MAITTIGLDLAKSVFQAHGIDENGATVLVKKLHRKQMLPFFSKLPPCLIGVEACGTAHHWARTLSAMGHEVRLIPPSYVKAFIKRGKSDAIDAEAICEAVQRPTMRFVPVKTVDQQAILMAHRARSLLVRQRTQAANALRSHLAELGLVANPGLANLARLAEQALADREALASFAREALEIMLRQIVTLGQEISELDRQIAAWHADHDVSRRLADIPGIGLITATAVAATVTDPDQFRSGRQFAAWLGLTPQQQSTGGKTRLGGISKQGDRYLRRLLVVGATAVIRHTKDKPTPLAAWIRKLMEKKPFRVVSVALANKLARIAWVVLTRKEAYRPFHFAA
jgi:transposase